MPTLSSTKPVLAAVAAAALAFTMTVDVEAQTQVAATGQTIVPGADGRQILFRDKTTLTAGPDSAVKVTRANYDAGSGTGNVVINVTKGAFRYVTGNTNGSHTIVTPLSTVGVRGTVIEGYVMPGGYEVFVLIEGAFRTCSRGNCQNVNTPGTYVMVNRGGNVTPPASIPSSFMSAMMLNVPQLNLALDHFSDILKSGRDPLIRFQAEIEIDFRASVMQVRRHGVPHAACL